MRKASVMYRKGIQTSNSWFGQRFPLGDGLSTGVPPQGLYKLDHVELGTHPTLATQDAPHDQRIIHQSPTQPTHASLSLLSLAEEQKGLKGRRAAAKGSQLTLLSRCQFIGHQQFSEVVADDCLEVDVELHRIVLLPLLHSPVPLPYLTSELNLTRRLNTRGRALGRRYLQIVVSSWYFFAYFLQRLFLIDLILTQVLVGSYLQERGGIVMGMGEATEKVGEVHVVFVLAHAPNYMLLLEVVYIIQLIHLVIKYTEILLYNSFQQQK